MTSDEDVPDFLALDFDEDASFAEPIPVNPYADPSLDDKPQYDTSKKKYDNKKYPQRKKRVYKSKANQRDINADLIEEEESSSKTELTENQINRLKKRAMNIVMWHLGQADKSTHWLRTKLQDKEIPEDIIEETMQFLITQKYVDDASYAERYVKSKRSSQSLSKKSLEWKLSRDVGIDKEIIEEVLSEYSEDDDREQAYELASKKVMSMSNVPDDKKHSRLIGQLSRKGYPASIVFSVVKEVIQEFNENNIQEDGE